MDQANIGAGPAQRPDQLRDPNLPGGERTSERWFDTAAFTLPAAFAFGTASRNSVIGPGYASVDAAIAKTWPVGGSKSLELRWEVFNLLNRANFDIPNRVFGTPNFGRIFSAKESPRNAAWRARDLLDSDTYLTHSVVRSSDRRTRLAVPAGSSMPAQ